MKTTIILSTATLAAAAIIAGVIAAFGQQWLWQWQDARTPLCIHEGQQFTPGNAKYYGCKLPPSSY
jgi:hypothetical protein